MEMERLTRTVLRAPLGNLSSVEDALYVLQYWLQHGSGWGIDTKNLGVDGGA